MKTKQDKPSSNSDITKSTMQYISLRTDYAVMLTGAWGSGKTYYVNNVLIPEIKKRQEHKAIVISLFGVSSVEEINIKIFIEMLPILSNDKVRVGGQIAKIILRGIMDKYRLGNLDKYIGDSEQVLAKLANQKKKLVVFFDDFERRGNISLSELTGYINTLVEDKNSKVVLITNEKEVSELKEATDEKNAYQPFKEKLVRSTLYFNPDFDTSLQEILDAKYGGAYKGYRSFLDNRTEEIKMRFVEEAQTKNLRTLSFALETFNYAFCSVYNWNEAHKKYKEAQLEKYLREMFLFSLAVCIEYREGRLQDVGLEEISHEKNFAEILEEQRRPVADKELGDTLSFRGKYYKGERYYPFQSLFNFIVGKDAFKTEVAISEIDELVEKDSPQHPEWQTYEMVKRQSHYDLGNKEFEKFYSNLLGYTIEGRYPPEDTIVASNHLVRIAEILRKDTNKLEKKLEGGIKKSFEEFGRDDNIEGIYHPNKPEYGEVTQKLIQSAIDRNNELKEKERSEKIAELNQLVKDDFDSFLEKIQRKPFSNEPVLQRIDFSSFNDAFQQLVNDGENRTLRQQFPVWLNCTVIPERSDSEDPEFPATKTY